MSHGQRLVALRARVGHDPEQVSLRIGDQQVAHMAQAHDPVGFVERGIASNRDECDVLEIGHDRQCRRSGIHPGAHGRLGRKQGTPLVSLVKGRGLKRVSGILQSS